MDRRRSSRQTPRHESRAASIRQMSRHENFSRSSAEIIAMSTAMRQRMQETKKTRSKNKKKKENDLDDAKRELDMDEHMRSINELLCEYKSDAAHGLTSECAEMRRKTEGLNILTPPKTTPEWIKFMKEITNFFALLLWVGAALCVFAYFLSSDVTNLYIFSALIFVVLATGIYSYTQNRKSSNLMESFKNMMPTLTTVIRDGTSQRLDACYLVRGDILLLKSGDKIPADVRILECSDDMQIDNASLTGESEPLKRVVDCTDENPLETRNLCFFGTFIPQGSCKALVINIGDKTVMGRIAKLATATGNELTPIAKEILHFVHIIAYCAITIGVIFFIMGIILKKDWITNLISMIAIIVSNVPEGLLATVTVCLTLTANRMAEKSVLVKNLESVETLGSTTCICSDKTGTLTQNIMTVANVVYDNQIYDAECSLTPEPSYDTNNLSYQALERCATLCNNAVFDEDSKYERVVLDNEDSERNIQRGNPVPFSTTVTLADGSQVPTICWDTIGDASESAMIKFVQSKKCIMAYREENKKLKEIPFNSRNKYQVSIHKQENRDDLPMLLVMKGAPERILSRCSQVLINGVVEELTVKRKNEIEQCQLTLSKKGMRVLGFCEKVLDLESYPPNYKFNTDNPNFPLGSTDNDYTTTPVPDKRTEESLCFLGLMALIDPPRPQVPPAVARCKSAGIKVIMVTGDHPITAKAIAYKVGILWGKTREDIEEENEKLGLTPGNSSWEDPDSAQAIVVPGWTISLDTPVSEWDRILDHKQIVFARTSPQQKLIIVENCQRRKEIVAVTGDGVNDSPALKKADIGIAMGIMGSEVSKEAADMILLDDNFASIVAGVEEGRLIFDNLKKSIAYTVTHNIPELVPFLVTIIISCPVPVSTILILAIDLGVDMIPAISFAYEYPEADIMERAPRNSQVDHLVTKKLVHRAYCTLGLIESIAGFFTWLVVLSDYGYPPSIIPGLDATNSFGKQVLWCKTQGGDYCSVGGKKDVNGQQILFPVTNCIPSYVPNAYEDNANDIFAARIFWNPGSDGKVIDCQYPLSNFHGTSDRPSDFNQGDPSTTKMYTNGFTQVTYQSMDIAWAAGYRPYYPFKARSSSFFDANWLKVDVSSSKQEGFGRADELFFLYQPIGAWGVTANSFDGTDIKSTDQQLNAFDGYSSNLVIPGNDTLSFSVDKTQVIEPTKSTKTYNKAVLGSSYSRCIPGSDSCLLQWETGFSTRSGGKSYLNIMSRMLQSEALKFAQTAYFGSIVVCQWGHLLACKTRWLSILSLGMKNSVMNFSIVYQLMFCSILYYISGINDAIATRPLRLTHWFAAMPFAIFIFAYEELRKFWMRSTSVVSVDKDTGRVIRRSGWLEYNTYY